MRNGGSDRRWPAAYELSRLMADPEGARRPDARPRRWSRPSSDANDGDPQVRRYLALAIGRLDPPLPPDAVDGPDAARSTIARRRNARSARSGRSARRAIRGRADARAALRSRRTIGHPQDGGLRARRAAGRRADRDAAHRAAGRGADVRWNAAVALARQATATACRCCGRCSIGSTSSRPSSATSGRTRTRPDRRRDDQRPARRRGAEGRHRSGRRSTSLSQQDRSMKVRQAALEALKVMG